MTRLLAKAIEEASRLPESLQDEIAERLLDDIHGEEEWDRTLARSADALETLADRALADFHAGRTKKLGFDEL
jgi:O-methyltransferase involved in polyketide biosynthesis